MFPHSLVPWWDLCGCVVFCFCFWFFWLTVFIADIHFALFLHLMLYYFLSASSIFRSTWMSVCRIYSKRSQFKKKATAFLSIAKWCSSKNLQKNRNANVQRIFHASPQQYACYSWKCWTLFTPLSPLCSLTSGPSRVMPSFLTNYPFHLATL